MEIETIVKFYHKHYDAATNTNIPEHYTTIVGKQLFSAVGSSRQGAISNLIFQLQNTGLQNCVIHEIN